VSLLYFVGILSRYIYFKLQPKGKELKVQLPLPQTESDSLKNQGGQSNFPGILNLQKSMKFWRLPGNLQHEPVTSTTEKERFSASSRGLIHDVFFGWSRYSILFCQRIVLKPVTWLDTKEGQIPAHVEWAFYV